MLLTQSLPHQLGRTTLSVSYDRFRADSERLIKSVERAFIEGSRSREGDLEHRAEAVRLFCSYSYRDAALRDELETHLKLLQRLGTISIWHDRKIGAGEEWKDQIDKNLEVAEIILLLVSADFIASDYCYDKEMSRALERHEAGSARVIPVILRDVDWHPAPFGKLQPLPTDGMPVMR